MSFPLGLNDIMSTTYFETRKMLCSFIAWMRPQSSRIAGCGDGINFAVELFCIFAASYSTLKRGHCRIHLKRYVLFAPESARGDSSLARSVGYHFAIRFIIQLL